MLRELLDIFDAAIRPQSLDGRDELGVKVTPLVGQQRSVSDFVNQCMLESKTRFGGKIGLQDKLGILQSCKGRFGVAVGQVRDASQNSQTKILADGGRR